MAENHLRVKDSEFTGSAGKLEWLYCFDIHCNAFLPVFLLLYVIQYFMLPILLMDHYLCLLLSVVLNIGALSYYHYLVCQGYSALPFLRNTEVFLAPVPLLVVLGIFSLVLRVNITKFVVSFHF